MATPNSISFYNNNTRHNVIKRFSFNQINDLEIVKAFLKLKYNSTGCDGISLKILNTYYPQIIPYLTHIINSFIESSTFPSSWKIADVVLFVQVTHL